MATSPVDLELLRKVWALLLGSSLLLLALPAQAHDLEIDRLQVRPFAEPETVLAQLLCDPELTRPLDATPSQQARERLVAFVRENVLFEVDGRRVLPLVHVRELWQRGGAVAGDLVQLRLAVGARPTALAVTLGKPFGDVVVAIDVASSGQPSDWRSVLLRGGETTPSFDLERMLGAGFSRQAPETFRRVQRSGTSAPGASVNPPESSTTAASSPTSPFGSSVSLGFRHVLPKGLDHVLFIVGLVLGARARGRRRFAAIAWWVSAFTLAHSLTLALGAVGVIDIDSRIVEPLIALSLVAVAVENFRPDPPGYLRGAVVFCFGLLHGLGFASALSETGFHGGAMVRVLLGFNVGVELAQLLVVALCLTPLQYLRPRREREVRWLGSAGIALTGMYWVIARLA